ncbi:putative intraflagellar transport protein D4 [Trypanosoma brucei equiperdum]|uniref:Putative intraflagellar transport protein D4 n=1 Tax=Trypanosoma brucei equiperdum TaxID=630700 RepID=A0A3L6L6T9_9TRYP|nr:putative intraflagellar transport protein D4 [Trypanosoma brucei equiperdum]
MHLYLTKRVAIPSTVAVTAVAWNEEQGWLAVGGKGGLLKVLKIDGGGSQRGGLAMNQTLEGHETDVSVVAWNHQYRKLTSSDAGGQIIVWMLHKGMWLEEMINNRNKSTVRDLAWSVDGTKVCIVYEDGAVILGGVDGNRLWGKDLKCELTNVTWSPDDRYILFGTKSGDVQMHDSATGHLVNQVAITHQANKVPLAGLEWSSAWVDRPEPLPSLAVCYKNGRLHLLRGITDHEARVVEAGINVTGIAWNPQGTMLAVCGVPATGGASGDGGTSAQGGATGGDAAADGSASSVLTLIYNGDGVHMRTLRMNGKFCGGITWEGDGLRVAVAVDAAMYFANVRCDYKYAYFHKTVVFAYNRPDRTDSSVMFWNTRNNERVIRHIRGLLHIHACRNACLIVNAPGEERCCIVQLVNAIGCPIESRMLDMEPIVSGLNSSHVVVADEENIYIWQFRDPSVVVDALDPVSVQMSRRETHDRVVHVDDFVRADTPSALTTQTALTNDLICTVCLSEDFLFVARESGLLQLYRFNPLQLVGKSVLPCRPQSIAVNCNSTRLVLIDVVGVMRIFHIDPTTMSLAPSKLVPQPGFERKDVWNVQWAQDDPEMLAVMERSRLHIYHGTESEEPITCSTHICKFRSLKVRSLLLDELKQDPERPRREYVIDHDTRALRDAREVMQTASTRDALRYMDEHSHPKLWSLFAEHALAQLDFDSAELAFIRCGDYPAIQFVKRIKTLDDPQKQRAEIHTYYHRFDQAEKIYKDIDRKDLALELRYRLGDWFRVVQLVQEGGGDESHMRRAWENIGDFYADRQKWTKAAQYYSQSQQLHKLAHILFLQEDYDLLVQLIQNAEHDRELLLKLGEMLLSVGLGEEALRAYLAAGEPRLAVESCTQLNQWDCVMAVAEEYKLTDVSKQLGRHATRLVDSGRLSEAIGLYRKAGQHDEAARLLAGLGQRAATTNPLSAKKFYVLSALEVEKYRKKKMTLSGNGTAAVEALLDVEQSGKGQERAFDAAWRGAEAYHFFLLCQQHILNRNLVYALNVAMRLMDYDDIISPVDSYSLIALTAYLAKNYSICSKAFTRLEAAEQMDEQSQSEGGEARGAVQLQMMDMIADLDVSCRTKVGHGVCPAGGGAGGVGGTTRLDGTTTSLQLTNPSKGAVSAIQMTYPTVTLTEPRRRFADLASKIFTQHKPEDNFIDRVKCHKCEAHNKEWASACVRCQQPFHVCIYSGRSITSEEFWQCSVCHHRLLDVETDRFRNCPLCHTPLRH